MNIDGSVALVTGADRGLGRAYARELVRRGAANAACAANDRAARLPVRAAADQYQIDTRSHTKMRVSPGPIEFPAPRSP